MHSSQHAPVGPAGVAEQPLPSSENRQMRQHLCLDFRPLRQSSEKKVQEQSPGSLQGLGCEESKSQSAVIRAKYISCEDACCFASHFFSGERVLVDSLPETTVSETIKCTPIIH